MDNKLFFNATKFVIRCLLVMGENLLAIEDARKAVTINSHSIPALETLGNREKIDWTSSVWWRIRFLRIFTVAFERLL